MFLFAALTRFFPAGGTDFIASTVAGIPFAGGIGPEYVVLEIHFDNPNSLAGVISNSGVRFQLTRNLRQHDAGILMIGPQVDGWLAIPPRTPSYYFHGMCAGVCTRALFPEGGIHVQSVLQHTHLLGREVETRVFRDGVEQPLLFADFSYDFNFQDFWSLDKPYHLLPGDDITVTCRYNSTGVNRFTTGGLQTKDEMCLSFLTYYPLMEGVSDCLSTNDDAVYFALRSEQLFAELPEEGRAQLDAAQAQGWLQYAIGFGFSALSDEKASVFPSTFWRALTSVELPMRPLCDSSFNPTRGFVGPATALTPELSQVESKWRRANPYDNKCDVSLRRASQARACASKYCPQLAASAAEGAADCAEGLAFDRCACECAAVPVTTTTAGGGATTTTTAGGSATTTTTVDASIFAATTKAPKVGDLSRASEIAGIVVPTVIAALLLLCVIALWLQTRSQARELRAAQMRLNARQPSRSRSRGRSYA